MVDFKSLLGKPLDSVQRPPVLPPGTYYGLAKSYKIDESRFANDDGTKNVVLFVTVQLSRAGDDVDAEELAVAEAIKKLPDRTMIAELPLSGGNEYLTKMVFDSLGVATAGKTWDTVIPEIVGAQVMLEVTKRMDKQNPEIWHNNARKLRAAA